MSTGHQFFLVKNCFSISQEEKDESQPGRRHLECLVQRGILLRGRPLETPIRISLPQFLAQELMRLSSAEPSLL